MPSDPLYGKFDAVLARCIEKFDDTQKQADRSHHDLSILRKFLEGWFCVSGVVFGVEHRLSSNLLSHEFQLRKF